MSTELQDIHPVLAANDVNASLQFYRAAGFTVSFEDSAQDPKYAVVRRDNVTLHIQWADEQQWAYPTDRPAYRFLVSDVDAVYAELVARGVLNAQSSAGSPWAAPANTPWGTREFHVRDPGLNNLQFYRPL